MTKNKKSFLSLLLTLLLVVSFLPQSVFAEGTSLSGSGTAADPYLISSAEDLGQFRTMLLNGSKTGLHFKLVDDINMENAGAWDGSGVTLTEGSVFDGNGHTIENLTYTGENACFINTNKGEIRNLTLSIGEFKDGQGYTLIGLLVAQNYKNIIGCSVKASKTITLPDQTASLFVKNNHTGGLIDFCSLEGNFTSKNNTFGLVGGNGGIIRNSFNLANLTNTSDDGAIYGISHNTFPGYVDGKNILSKIDNCLNLGNITAKTTAAGICGTNGTEIFNVYNGGKVTGFAIVYDSEEFFPPVPASVKSAYYLEGTGKGGAGAEEVTADKLPEIIKKLNEARQDHPEFAEWYLNKKGQVALRRGFTLTYDANGGEDDPTLVYDILPQTGYKLDETIKPTHKPTNGKTVVFKGWTSEPNQGKIYKKKDTLPELLETIDIKQDTTVYAVWAYGPKVQPSGGGYILPPEDWSRYVDTTTTGQTEETKKQEEKKDKVPKTNAQGTAPLAALAILTAAALVTAKRKQAN